MTTTHDQTTAAFIDLRRRMDDLPEHKRREAETSWAQYLGYAWGRQDEAGRTDHVESWGFGIWAATRKVDYLTERVSSHGPIQDLWDQYHEEEEPTQ